MRGIDALCLGLGLGSAALLGVLLFALARGAFLVSPVIQWTLCAIVGSALLLSLSQLVLHCWGASRECPADEHAHPSRLSSQPLDYLVSLLNVSRAVSTGASLEELGQVVVDSCRDCFDSDDVSLMVLEPNGENLAVKAFAGHRDSSVVRNARVPLGQGVAGKVAQTRTPIILGPQVDARQFPGFQAKARRITSSMVAPIVVRNRVVGVLNASTCHPDKSYSEDDLRVLCILAEHAGIVAAKARDAERVVRIIRRFRRRDRRRNQEAESLRLLERRAA
jgi:putative methionine-R-sulfoxide reductase with GAF domain